MTTPIPAAPLHDTIDRAANATDEALHRGVERTQRVAHTAVDRGAEAAGRVQKHYGRVHDKLGECAQDQPVATIALAAAVGAALGLLLFRRRRSDD